MNKKKANQNEVRRCTVTIAITEEERDKIGRMAFEQGLSKSTFMRILALKEIAKYDKRIKKKVL